jgi:ribosome-associated translation inhibitor RaiA
MASSGEQDIDVEVRADQAVSPAVTARAVELVRRLATASGRQIQYAAVALGVDDQWRGRRSSQVEIVVDTVGIYVRGFAAGATFSEALDELERRLERRLAYARDRVRSRSGLRPGPPRSLLASPRHRGSSGAAWAGEPRSP